MTKFREYMIKRGIKKVLKTLLRYEIHLVTTLDGRLFIVANEDENVGIELEEEHDID